MENVSNSSKSSNVTFNKTSKKINQQFF
jgi:hypothetical protein